MRHDFLLYVKLRIFALCLLFCALIALPSVASADGVVPQGLRCKVDWRQTVFSQYKDVDIKLYDLIFIVFGGKNAGFYDKTKKLIMTMEYSVSGSVIIFEPPEDDVFTSFFMAFDAKTLNIQEYSYRSAEGHIVYRKMKGTCVRFG